jgi:phosphatidylglycerol lysyltransferase
VFVLAQHKFKHTLAATGRALLALVIVISAIANVSTLFVESRWDFVTFMEPFMDLGGPGWEREGLILMGVTLLLIARALFRGKRQAWWLSICLLAISLVSAITSKSDRSSMLIALSLLILLLMLAPLFPRRSDTRALVRGYIALALTIFCIISYALVSYFWPIGFVHAPFVLRDGLLFMLHVVSFLVLGFGVVEILRPVHSTLHQLDNERVHVYEIMNRYGNLATTHFVLGGDKTYFWSETGKAFIAYRIVHSVALALGDPIGPEEEHATILMAFLEFCRRQDWPVALYQASARTHYLCQERGLLAYKIGEEALIDVARFTLLGKCGAPVRHAIARARRAGLSAQCWQGFALPQAMFTGMQCISAEWLDLRKVQTQMGFSMGRFPADWTKDLLTVVALDPQGKVEAFLTWTPLYAGNGWALDTMRRGEGTPSGAMELLITHAIEWAQAHGYAHMSLGLAPLVGLAEEELVDVPCNPWQSSSLRSSSLVERGAAFLHQRGILLGKYRSLYFFKAKFQPTWEPRYLIVSERPALLRILLALARAHGSGWLSIVKEMWLTVEPISTIVNSVTKRLIKLWPHLEKINNNF